MLARQPGLIRLPLWLRNLNFTGRTVTAGTFSGDHVLSQLLRITGTISPAQITATQNDYNPTGFNLATRLRLSTDGTPRTISGFLAGSDGKIILLDMVSGAGISITHEDAGSSAANRINTNGITIFLSAGNTVALIYDGASSRWRQLSSAANLASTGAVGSSRFAAASEYRSNVGDSNGACLTPANAWAAAQPFGLTDAATIAVDFSAGFNFTVTLGGNRTLGNPTNQKHQSGWFAITQDGTGTRTLSYSADWEFAGASAFTLSTGAGQKDVLFYSSLAANSHVFTGILKNVS